jgi:hypothetical protein
MHWSGHKQHHKCKTHWPTMYDESLQLYVNAIIYIGRVVSLFVFNHIV